LRKKQFVNRTFVTLLILVVLLASSGFTALAKSMQVGIYTTTDMHGRVYGLDPITEGEVSNSFLKVASAMKVERDAMDDTILIDVGDVIQGTPITSYNVNVEGGKENPVALALRHIGYDAFVIGNHEFNFNMEVQGIFYDMLRDITGRLPGKPVNVLGANYIDIASQEPRLDPYIIRTFPLADGTEFKVGVLGFGNVNVPNWDLPSHYEGADFVHADNTERTLSYEWDNYWKKQLVEVEKCDLVIVAAHTGEGAVDYDGKPVDLQDQITHLATTTSGIDIIFGGHDHTSQAKIFQNKNGEDVIYLNGGGDTLGKIVLSIEEDGKFSLSTPENLPLEEYEDDVALASLMKPYYDVTIPFVSEQIGTLAGEWDDVTDYHTVQGDTYDLVQKAQIWASGADVSITTPIPQRGFALSQLFEEGADTAPISLRDCYALYRYDNNLLYMVEMTGKQLKDWLEHSAKTYRVENGKVVGGGYGTDIAYGVDYDVYVGNPEGERVQNVRYKGKPLADDEILKVALSSYRLSANPTADAYGWYAVTGISIDSPEVIWEAPLTEEFGAIGGSISLIIGEYIKAMTDEGQLIRPGAETNFRVLPESSN